MKMLKRLCYWWNKDRAEFWSPFNPSMSNMVSIGDYLRIVKLTTTIDYIAMSMGMNHENKAGQALLWKVIHKYPDDLMLQHGTARIFVKYNKWEHNVEHCSGGFLRDACSYAHYYHDWNRHQGGGEE